MQTGDFDYATSPAAILQENSPDVSPHACVYRMRLVFKFHTRDVHVSRSVATELLCRSRMTFSFFLRRMGKIKRNPFTIANPFLGTKILGFSIGRGLGALKGLSSPHSRMTNRHGHWVCWISMGEKSSLTKSTRASAWNLWLEWQQRDGRFRSRQSHHVLHTRGV